MSRNIYRDVGCSQEDHLPNCGHFGESGAYLSPHAKYCKSDKFEPCTCNPKAREERDSVPSAPTQDWPEIPSYLKDPLVFQDKTIGLAMVAIWCGEQWVFRVHNGQWCSLRKTNPSDPLLIKPLNVVAAAPQSAPSHCYLDNCECDSCRYLRGLSPLPESAAPTASVPTLEEEAREQSAVQEKSVSDLAAGVVMLATASHDAGCDCDLCFDGDALCEHVKGMEEELVRLRAAESRCKVLEGLLATALGWLSYADLCDEFYFSEEQAPGFAEFRAEARKALGDHQ